MNDRAKAIVQWCVEHQILYMGVVLLLISLGAQLLGPLMAEFVTGSPLDFKARFLAKFVTGLGSVHTMRVGVIIGEWNSHKTSTNASLLSYQYSEEM